MKNAWFYTANSWCWRKDRHMVAKKLQMSQRYQLLTKLQYPIFLLYSDIRTSECQPCIYSPECRQYLLVCLETTWIIHLNLSQGGKSRGYVWNFWIISLKMVVELWLDQESVIQSEVNQNKQILYINACMRNLEKWYRWTNKNKDVEKCTGEGKVRWTERLGLT